MGVVTETTGAVCPQCRRSLGRIDKITYTTWFYVCTGCRFLWDAPNVPVGAATPDPAAIGPSVCPFCKSGQVSTKSKSSSNDAYWRCGGCGQMWNPTRMKLSRGARY
jgi:transposase-like protein